MAKFPIFLTNTSLYRLASWCGPLSVLVVACGLFETQPFYPSSFQTQEMDLIPKAGEVIKYSYEEYFQSETQGHFHDTLVYSGKIEWTRIGVDESMPGIRIKRLAKTDGTVGIRLDTISASLGDNGFVILAQEFFGGGILPLPSTTSNMDKRSWKLLPSQLELGDQWRWLRGNWICNRQVMGMDTLSLGGNLFQAWVISETLSESEKEISTGKYWFTNQGMVQAEWVWPGIDRTDDKAEDMGQVAFKRVVRREI